MDFIYIYNIYLFIYLFIINTEGITYLFNIYTLIL